MLIGNTLQLFQSFLEITGKRLCAKQTTSSVGFIHKSGDIVRTKNEFCCSVKSSTTDRYIRSDRQEVELVVWIYRNKKRVLAAERNRGVAVSSVSQGCTITDHTPIDIFRENISLLTNFHFQQSGGIFYTSGSILLFLKLNWIRVNNQEYGRAKRYIKTFVPPIIMGITRQ